MMIATTTIYLLKVMMADKDESSQRRRFDWLKGGWYSEFDEADRLRNENLEFGAFRPIQSNPIDNPPFAAATTTPSAGSTPVTFDFH